MKIMETNPPTIKEIARQLKVSESTVSRALNDHPRIGLQTKTRVQQLAKQLGYEPNAMAIFFKQKKSHIIGVVIPRLQEEFFSQAISGIEAAAMEHKYTILFGQSYDDPERERLVIEAMKKQRVDGVIISLSKATTKYDHINGLKKFDIPVVFFDRVPDVENIHKVYCNLRQGTVDIVNWLFKQGRRRIAFINGPEKMAATKERLKGYIDGIAGVKMKVDMQLVETSDLSKESTNAAMKKLLSLKHLPQAVITFNDYVHMDAIQYAQQQGIRVNKDIMFVSYANLPITSYTAYPPIVSIEQYPYMQGERAMEIMIKILKDKSSNAGSTIYAEEIPATLVLHR